MRSRFLLVPVLALSLSGCLTLEPAYKQPAAPLPATFPQGGPYPAVTSAGATAAQTAWSDFFVDPRLREVIALALKENRDLRVAAINIIEARARYRVQRSDLLPTLDATFSAYSAKGISSAGGGGAGAATGTTAGTTTTTGGTAAGGTTSTAVSGGGGSYRFYSAQAGFSSYELDLFGRVRSLTKAAFETYLSTVEARRASQISLVGEVATDYLTLAADTQRLMTEQETLKADLETLRITQARLDAGISSELDVRQAQVAVETSRAAIANDTTQGAVDLNALNLVVGVSVPQALLPQGLDDHLLTQGDAPAGLSSAVLLQRPDVLEAEHTLKAYNADIGAARAAFFPTISLTANGGSSSLYLTQLFSSGSGAYTFAPNVSLPIFNYGANRANLKLSRAQRDSAVASYERAIQSAFQDVANALAQRGTIDQLLGAQRRLVEATQGSLKLSQARYLSGSDTYLNVLTAQTTLATAKQSLITAQLTRATNLVSLYRALGGGDGPTAR